MLVEKAPTSWAPLTNSELTKKIYNNAAGGFSFDLEEGWVGEGVVDKRKIEEWD